MKLLDNYGSIRKVNLLVIDMSSGRAMLASDALSDSLSVDVQHYTDAAFFFHYQYFLYYGYLPYGMAGEETG